MKKLTILMLLLALPAVASIADTNLDIVNGYYPGVINGLSTSSSRADTLYLIGGPDRFDGKFQDSYSGVVPDAQGWVGMDLTAPDDLSWHISTYMADNLDPNFIPNHAIYCGDETIPSCGGTDPEGGYANSMDFQLEWYGLTANPYLATNVTVQAVLNHDNEPGYDYLYLQYEKGDYWETVAEFNGIATDVNVDVSFTVLPSDYSGPTGDLIHLRWQGSSDGAWSDADCMWPTSGMAQVDNISVLYEGTQVIYDEFETGMVNSNWSVSYPPSVGNFAKVWPLLYDVDPCSMNDTPQFGFIDDGIIVPETGGTLGQTWTYGPQGYIVNLLGGIAGPDFHIQNEIWSPTLQWPAGSYDGCEFSFDIYRHQILTNGLFYVWHVSSSTDGGETWDSWQDRSFVYYGGPDYLRSDNVVTDLMLPGRDAVRLSLGIYEIGWIWGFEATDGTPSPYFDNVAFKIYEFGGPGISAREIDLAQDSFPAIGDLNFSDLGANDVHFDMARNIALADDLINLPGDSIVVDISAVRSGSELLDAPKLYWAMKQNPLFDPYRADPATSGWVYGDTTYVNEVVVVPERWNFDLPDEDFLYPGDVLHYYIEAQDFLGGDIGTTLLPGNLDGFGVFPGDQGYTPLLWNSSFIVRALPTITDDQGAQTEILLWNDFGSRGGENEWVHALGRLGYEYDLYYTNGPSSGVGNGLGGRATPAQIAGYETILYTSGNLSSFTLSNGDYENDAGNDVNLLDSWLQFGNRNILLTGDKIVTDLMNSGSAGVSFVSTWLSLDYLGESIKPFVQGQSSPLVLPIAGNGVFDNSFIAYGGCPVAEFDVVEPNGNAERIAEFAAPNGSGGSYSYAAGIYNQNMNSNVVYFPVDFSSWYTPSGASTGMPARTEVLADIMLMFGYIPPGHTTDVPQHNKFALSCFPNPFNPSSEIRYQMPIDGNLKVAVYNIRGEMVASLFDDQALAGPGVLSWDGRSSSGSKVASGAYFIEAFTDKSRLVEKIMLVK
ncbi:MAG: hypothetical protein GY752_11225 [bacterium]|nr:hypothetical protein [bacterium]